MRSPKKRSLLSVNEHFEGKRNDKIHFLFTLAIGNIKVLLDNYKWLISSYGITLGNKKSENLTSII